MGNSKNKKKRRSRNLKKSNRAVLPTLRVLKEEYFSNNLRECPKCGITLTVSKELPELRYCPACSLFFLDSGIRTKSSDLFSGLSVIKELSDIATLFSERIPGIVSAIVPDIEEGILAVLRHLHRPESNDFTQAIREEKELKEYEISLYVNNTGFDRSKVVTVVNALRKALNKAEIDAGTRSYGTTSYILNFSCTPTEAKIGEKIRLQWDLVSDKNLSYLLRSKKDSSKINSTGSKWVTVYDTQEEFTVEVRYKQHRLIDSKSIRVKVVPPPTINSLQSNLPSPIMESERVTVSWDIKNAERVILIHHYNDYEQLTIDVTDKGGSLSFSALRNEKLEIIAKHGSMLASKSIMIEVVPLPKFKVSEIPQLTDYSNLELSRIIDLSYLSSKERLFEALREISSLSGVSPYKGLKANLKDLTLLVKKICK